MRFLLPLLAFVGNTAFASTWSIDPSHTRVGFEVSHMTISSVEGGFTGVTGTLEYDVGKLTDLKVTVEVDMATVDTGNADRDGHLAKEDFLDVAKYPKMTFVSKKVKSKGKGEFELIGDLTLRGVTRPVTLVGKGLDQSIVDPWGNTRVGAKATGVINRKEFGVNYGAVLDQGGVMVGDEVTLNLSVEFVQAK